MSMRDSIPLHSIWTASNKAEAVVLGCGQHRAHPAHATKQQRKPKGPPSIILCSVSPFLIVIFWQSDFHFIALPEPGKVSIQFFLAACLL